MHIHICMYVHIYVHTHTHTHTHKHTHTFTCLDSCKRTPIWTGHVYRGSWIWVVVGRASCTLPIDRYMISGYLFAMKFRGPVWNSEQHIVILAFRGVSISLWVSKFNIISQWNLEQHIVILAWWRDDIWLWNNKEQVVLWYHIPPSHAFLYHNYIHLVATGIEDGFAQFLFLVLIMVPENDPGSSVFSTSPFPPHQIPIKIPIKIPFSSSE